MLTPAPGRPIVGAEEPCRQTARPTEPRPDVLAPDTALELPRVTVLRASAGSGKTWTLTRRYVQLALSRRVPANGLASLLAITFSNNATREMKENVLEWLKRLALREEGRTAAMEAIVEGGALADRAADLLERILDGWSDFQVRTIDSFMNSVFRGAAIGFGYSPETETTTRLGPIVDYAFDLFLREAGPGGPAAALLDGTVRKVLANRREQGAFAWDPVALLRDTVASLEGVVSELEEPLAAVDVEPSMRELEGPDRRGPRVRGGARAHLRPRGLGEIEARHGPRAGPVGALHRAARHEPAHLPGEEGQRPRRGGEGAVRRASWRNGAWSGPGWDGTPACGPARSGPPRSGCTRPCSRRSAPRGGCAAPCTSGTSSASCATGWTRARCPTCTSSSAKRSTTG